MTLRDLIDSGITIEGYIKVQCWENESYPEIYHEGYYLSGIQEEYVNKKISYIFPWTVSDHEAGICIELEYDDSITYEESMADVVAYLESQEESYFADRDTTKADVMADKELLGLLATEHRKCVNRYGNDRDWSCADACDNEPGVGGWNN